MRPFRERVHAYAKSSTTTWDDPFIELGFLIFYDIRIFVQCVRSMFFSIYTCIWLLLWLLIQTNE